MNFSFQKEILRVLPVWIRLYNLPLFFWGKNTLGRIASDIDVPICADECTNNIKGISYVRVLVEVDIIGNLPNTIKIVDPWCNEIN